MTTATVATLIRTARTKAGLSQRAVAEAFDYKSPQNVSGWESGRTTPPPNTYKKLCVKLKIPKPAFKRALMERYEKTLTKLLD